MALTSIIIFSYNRPENFKRLIESLKQNVGFENHDIFVFIDGPKTIEDIPKINKVESLAKLITTNIHRSPVNQGLANSIISGVTDIINRYGSVIVLEDDLILHPQFLNYMDEALEKFKDDKHILSICGYGLKIKKPKDYQSDIYLARRSSSWGWATWADRWNQIDWEVKDFDELKNSKKLQKQFNLGGSDMYSMLKGYMEGKNNSWAIRFCYHQAKNGLYSIHPFNSLVDNEGYGENASNCNQKYSRFKIEFMPNDKELNLLINTQLVFNSKVDRQLRAYHSIQKRIYSKIRKILNI